MVNHEGLKRREFIRLSATAALSTGLLVRGWGFAPRASASQAEGELFFAATVDTDLVLFRRPLGESPQPLTQSGVASSHPEPIPGSERMAYIETMHTSGRLLFLTRSGEKRERTGARLKDLNVRYPAASSSGDAVAISIGGDLHVVEPFVEPPTVHQLTANPSYDVNPTWSPDGTAVAFTRLTPPDPRTGLHSSDIFKFDFGSDRVTQLTDSGHAADPRWSPSGEWIAWDDQKNVQLVTPTGREASIRGNGGLGVTWSPDGTYLAYGRKASLLTLDVSTGEESVAVQELQGEVHSPAWDYSGERIAFLVAELGLGSGAYEFDRRSGNVRKVRRGVSRDLAYAPV